MAIDSLFRTSLNLQASNSEVNTLYCPGFNKENHPYGYCYNHEVGTFSYCGDDDGFVRRMTFVGTNLESYTRTYEKEELPANHRVRGLSTITVFCCEYHGQWIEKRSFQKGCTDVTRMFVEAKPTCVIFPEKYDESQMLFNLLDIKNPDFAFIKTEKKYND